MLVSPDGSVLSKEQVLRDLNAGGLIFYSIELTHALVRIHGKTALVTGESRTVTSRENKRTTTHFRFIAVYVDHESTLQLTHFQSVTLPDYEGCGRDAGMVGNRTAKSLMHTSILEREELWD